MIRMETTAGYGGQWPMIEASFIDCEFLGGEIPMGQRVEIVITPIKPQTESASAEHKDRAQ